jgi:hypothetical protein
MQVQGTTLTRSGEIIFMLLVDWVYSTNTLMEHIKGALLRSKGKRNDSLSFVPKIKSLVVYPVDRKLVVPSMAMARPAKGLPAKVNGDD